MGLKLVMSISCLTIVIHHTLNGRVSDALPISIDSILERAGWISPPKSVDEWKTAFVQLHTMLNITRFSELNNLNLTLYSELKDQKNKYDSLNLTLYSELKDQKNKYDSLNFTLHVSKNETKQWKDNYNKLAAVQISRNAIERGEKNIDYDMYIPEKKDMMKKLQKEPGFLNTTAVEEAKSLQLSDAVHKFKWLYYITYSEKSFAQKLRHLLTFYHLSAYKLAGIIDDIYKVTCERIHNLSEAGYTPEKLRAGLEMYGVIDEVLLDCAEIICKIPKLTGFIVKTTTTTSTGSKETNST